MTKYPIQKLWQEYTKPEFFKALLMGFLVVLVYAGIVLPPIIMISMLYVPYMIYFLLLIYVLLSLSFSRGLTIMMETLQTYKKLDTIPYNIIQKRSSIVIAVIIFVIESYVYITYLQ